MDGDDEPDRPLDEQDRINFLRNLLPITIARMESSASPQERFRANEIHHVNLGAATTVNIVNEAWSHGRAEDVWMDRILILATLVGKSTAVTSYVLDTTNCITILRARDRNQPNFPI
jgi:hypothetical protein